MSKPGRKTQSIILKAENDPALWRYASVQATLDDALPSRATMISNNASPEIHDSASVDDDPIAVRNAYIRQECANGCTQSALARQFEISPQGVQ